MMGASSSIATTRRGSSQESLRSLLTSRSDSKATKDESSHETKHRLSRADRGRIQNPAAKRDSLVAASSASTSALTRQVASKNTSSQQQTRTVPKRTAMASKIDNLSSKKSSQSPARDTATVGAVAIAAKKVSTQSTRVDKKRRIRSPPTKANETVDTKQLVRVEAMSPSSSSSSDDSTTNNDRIKSIASVFRGKPSTPKGLRIEAPVFVPRSSNVPSIRRAAAGLSINDESNTRHSTAVVQHRKSPPSYSIANRVATPGYYLLEVPNGTPLWAPESMPTVTAMMNMSQSRPVGNGQQLKILPPRIDSPTVPLYASSSLVPRARSFIFQGVKVTMVDERTKVFVIDLCSRKECEAIRSMIDQHVAEVSTGGEEAKGWRSLYTYTKMDLPCSEIVAMQPIVTKLMRRIVHIVGEVYGETNAASNLKPRSWKEPHLLKYQKEKSLPEHTGIEMHYDGCDITWQLMLTDLSEYKGGGTYIRTLRKTLKLHQGQVLVHPGELYHKGLDITRGTRILMVCFMDGFDPKIVDRSDPRADRKEFEKNVCLF